MEEECKSRRGEASPQLLDLIPNERDWRDGGDEVWKKRGEFGGEEKDLELRLGLPGGKDESLLTGFPIGFFGRSSKNINVYSCAGAKRGFLHTVENPNEDLKKQEQVGFFHLQNRAGFVQEMQQQTNGGKADKQKSIDKKAAHATAANGAGGTNSSSQTRNSSGPVVGWPPVRSSFRKNLASTSSKPSVEQPPPNSSTDNRGKVEEPKKGLLVKINMDGIPIGRKVDLNSFDSYDKLSLAVEELFRGLLAARMEPASVEAKNADNKQVFSGLLNGTGQYTLVYEDNEGDRMLVGDVPWDMFISTAKRLRVLKSSDLSTLQLGAMGRTKKTDC